LEIYILRHGIAVPGGTPGYSELERPLTEEGRAKMLKAGKGIAAVVGEVDLILASPLKRAQETALLAARVLGGKEKMVTFDALKPGTPPEALLKALEPYRGKARLMLVGHEPDLSMFASFLAGAKGSVLALKKGGLCRVDVGELPSKEPGILRWLLTPGQLRALDREE
jgi:phosphohistidine phosphatase